MKQKQRRKNNETRDKNKKQKESQKRKTRRKKNGQEQERDRERDIEKGGGPKRLRRNKGRHSKINKKYPFLGEKNIFCIEKQRKERGKKQDKTKQKNNK